MNSENTVNFHRLVQGPAQENSDLKKKYEPVSCEFTDELEDISVRKLPVDVDYWDTNGEILRACGRIVDIFTTVNKEEFMKLDDGTFMRLDKIREVKTR